MRIENYLEDGANWQAQATLAYLRQLHEHALGPSWDKEKARYTATLDVGRYENCREQGYIFSIRYGVEQRNYAVYEHRNSDKLCVIRFDGWTMNTPEAEMVWDNMKDKWDVTISFDYGEIVKCGDWLVEDMRAFLDEEVSKIKKEN